MKSGAINFHSQNIKFSLKNKSAIRKWILSVIEKEKHSSGEINYIFCEDKYLFSLNKKYLKHNTLTDIITFDYSTINHQPLTINHISGDIFISIPRVKENAKKYNFSFEKELHRVMIHGVLHLCGYKDKTPKEKTTMRQKEEEFLKIFR